LQTEFCEDELSLGEEFSGECIEESFFDVLAGTAEVAVLGGGNWLTGQQLELDVRMCFSL
jgi:hypothetical protein